jgi:tetratricopeptide (TPR) repeat protein
MASLALLAVIPPQAAAVEGVVTFGAPAELVEGAAALERRRYADGVALTEAGLRQVTSADQRASGLNNLCAGYTALQRYDTAVRHCTASLALDDRSWQAYNNRALAYIGLGLLHLARLDVQRGLELQPESLPLWQVRAMVEQAARQQTEVRRSRSRT